MQEELKDRVTAMTWFIDVGMVCLYLSPEFLTEFLFSSFFFFFFSPALDQDSEFLHIHGDQCGIRYC